MEFRCSLFVSFAFGCRHCQSQEAKSVLLLLLCNLADLVIWIDVCRHVSYRSHYPPTHSSLHPVSYYCEMFMCCRICISNDIPEIRKLNCNAHPHTHFLWQNVSLHDIRRTKHAIHSLSLFRETCFWSEYTRADDKRWERERMRKKREVCKIVHSANSKHILCAKLLFLSGHKSSVLTEHETKNQQRAITKWFGMRMKRDRERALVNVNTVSCVLCRHFLCNFPSSSLPLIHSGRCA